LLRALQRLQHIISRPSGKGCGSYVEGQNIAFEYRSPENKLERLPDLAAELVRIKVDIIYAPVTPAAQAAKNATKTIPIVFSASSDPVGFGLVASLARPGGNVAGLSMVGPDLSGKRLELLKEVVPGVSRVAVLWNSANSPRTNRGSRCKESGASHL